MEGPRTARLATRLLAAGAIAAALIPERATALVRVRTGPLSAFPVSVEPSPPLVQLWIDAQAVGDAAPLGMTLSDGQRYRRGPLPPRWQLGAGIAIRPLAAALQVGMSTVALAAQLDVVDRAGWKLGLTAAARGMAGGEYDFAVVPDVATRRALGRGITLVPFGAARLRWGRTLYEVQGWSADLSSPFASATTRDLAVAPMAGIAAVSRLWELRLTAGWELFLVDRVESEWRPTGFSRSGGAFAAVALRLRLGSAE